MKGVPMELCHFLYGALFALCWIGGRAQYSGCNGTSWIADGYCDLINNNNECGYDGGDCCECTCSGGRLYPCGFNGFECLDPSASNVTSECQNTVSNSRLCSTNDTVQDFAVNDTASARAFAEAVNCTGGTFNVTWKGRVVLDRTIYVAQGTTVNLSGTNPGSEVDGGGKNRIFSLVDASLHLFGIILSNGNATYGGAIAAVGSRVSLNGTTFNNNAASNVAGAIYMKNSTFIAGGGQVTFATNFAGLRGGALVAESDSHISWNGPTLFLDNTAFYYGGAMYIHISIVSWSGKTSFVNNSGGSGGSFYISDNSRASWSGETSFASNNGYFGGAIYIDDKSDVSWSAETSFINNSATAGSGGALYIDGGSDVWWDGNTSFSNNAANWSGGALFIYENSTVSWFAGTSYINNSGEFGGAIYAHTGSDVSWTSTTSFINNNAFAGSGGALYIDGGSDVWWDGNTSFSNNAANWSGGGLFIYENSTVSWFAETSYINNSGEFGGAIYAHAGSDVFWTSTTSFINNNAFAGSGGAFYVDDGCNVWWDGNASFSNNAANWSGGALFIYENSTVSWTAQTSFFNNNAATGNGGALRASDGCSIWWDANTSFTNNSAIDSGGALSIYNKSNVSWLAETSFHNNEGDFGGAIYIRAGSRASWTAATSFINNNAFAGSGGALYIHGECNVWWDGATSFISNVANWSGGAILIYDDSSVSWAAQTLFNNNIAEYSGGAIIVMNGSTTSWGASTTFFNNTARFYWGGAILLHEISDLFWVARTLFVSNTAGEMGGGLASMFGSTITMAGDAFFLDNVAGTDGGGAYIYHSDDQEQSFLIINSTTVFRRNRCETNGGGMAVIGSVSTVLETASMTFSENIAGVAGGAVYVSGAVFGPKFVGTRFDSNSAEMGGGVYATGSGIAVVPNILGVPEPQDPFTFISCEFSENKAATRGGALDTGAGIDRIVNTLFMRNTAGTGGALRLAGEASLEGCEFIENSSDEDKGPAVYNEGLISNMSNGLFVNNVFNCESKHFFTFNESDVSLDTVCKDCDVCENCVFVGQTPMCVEEIDHSTSPGGNTTVELLSIDHGYWRVSNTSIEIRDCYNTNACKGGVTGDAEYCLKGYEGPYCSVCSDGYTPSLGSTCNKCSDTNGPGIALLVVFSVVAFVVCVAILNYMLSGQERSADRGIVARISRFIPFQSLKIIVVVWQILTQFCTVTNFSFPGIYQTFLDGVDLLNFDFSWVISTGCIVNLDFHDRLLISTLGPIVGIAILGATYTIAIYRHRGSEAVRHIVRRKHLSMILLLTFLVYSSVSTTVFTMFACDELDDGTSYLRVDYRIDCDSSEHKALQIYAGFMIVLYAAGIPSFYVSLLFSNRDTLTKDENRENNDSVAPFEDLWKPYKPRYFFYEVVECFRRVLLAGIVVFIFPDTAAQIAVALILATAFFIFSEALAPYESPWDCLVSRMGHAIVVTSLFLALLLKVDVSDEGAKSQQAFEAVLITLHVTMIVVVIIEGAAMIVAWKKEIVSEDPGPRSGHSVGVESFTEEIAHYDR